MNTSQKVTLVEKAEGSSRAGVGQMNADDSVALWRRNGDKGGCGENDVRNSAFEGDQRVRIKC